MLANVSAALLRFVARLERKELHALAEYALVLALIAVFLLAVLGLLAESI